MQGRVGDTVSQLNMGKRRDITSHIHTLERRIGKEGREGEATSQSAPVVNITGYRFASKIA